MVPSGTLSPRIDSRAAAERAAGPTAGGMPAPVDTVIRGGLVVDGTGETKARVADVAIKDGLIVAVGPELSEKGGDEIDASGLLVTPGWCAPLPARRAPWPAAAALPAALAVAGSGAVGGSRCRRQRCGRSRLAANAADADSG